MATRLIVDTNAYRAFTDGIPSAVDAIQLANEICFSVIVLGELRAGFLNGTQLERNEATLRLVLEGSKSRIVPVSSLTSIIYAQIWKDLKTRGAPIPTNDVWIAAPCLEIDGTLLTRDRHFNKIPGLRIATIE